ncbi:MAG: DUF4301 family protein [Rikenellaceae bacterium]
MFTSNDVEQMASHGVTPELVERQVESFKSGFPYLNIARAARLGDGIFALDGEAIAKAGARYDQERDSLQVVKFVPASGAATRMFKELFEFVNDDKRGKGIDTLLNNIEKFAFYPELKALLEAGADDKAIVSAIVAKGLDYGSKPKALVSFHAYTDGARKAVEEHLVEGADYAATSGVSKIHFTVSPEHLAGFKALIAEKQDYYEAKFGIKYEISFSTQKSSTDTVAVNPDNTLFRTDDGKLLFRPAGHGALIENVGDINADLIFIKTIDNVTTDALRADTITYKRVLAGLLLELQADIFAAIKSIDNGEATEAAIAAFIESRLLVKLPEGSSMELLRAILDRPIRVCGMVRNEGEPGGGPFWVKGVDGSESLQIAESSQISPEQISLMSEATHFNPVDILCGVKNHRGERYNLKEYVDPTTGFISSKSSGGRELRAQELPGLWNGAMANWTTIFVEVPISTFTPVKVVQDLLRDQHQTK